jgi:hypothetical protein
MSSTESVTYSSTRGGEKGLDFRTVVMQGLARDRGLFVPDTMPSVSPEELASWRGLSYADLAVCVIRKFVGDDQVPEAKLRDIVHRSCAAFRHKDVTPVVPVAGHAILVRSQRCVPLLRDGRVRSAVTDPFSLQCAPCVSSSRNYFTDRPSPSRTWRSKCLGTSSSTSWKRVATGAT